MLDPIIRSALVILVAQGLKALAAYLGIVLDEELVNTLAAIIVTWLLALLGLNLIKAGARRLTPGAFDRGLLGDDDE